MPTQNVRMLILLTAIVLLLSVLSERIVESQGLGYDGATYGTMAIRFQEYLNDQYSIPADNSYYRFLPSILCHYSLRALRIGLTVPNVITFFQVYEGVLLLGTCLLWCLLSDALSLGPYGKWWGFLGFFGNYAVLKYGFYYPVLMDLSAMFLGTWLLFAYLMRQPIIMVILTGLSFFVWPATTIMGVILWLFPFSAQSPPPSRPGFWSSVMAVAVISLLLIPRLLSPAPMKTAPHFEFALPLAVAYMVCYLFFCFRGLFPGLRSILTTLRERGLYTRVGSVAVFVVAALLLPRLSPKFLHLDWLSLLLNYLQGLISLGYRRPAEFSVTLILYYGPIMSFLIFYYEEFMDTCRRLGGGYILVMIFLTLQSLNPLSRQMISGLPFVILPLASILDRKRFSAGFSKVFVVSSLVVSKVWLLNNAGMDKGQARAANLLYWRRYTSSTGWWMAGDLYIIQGYIIISGLFLMAIYLRTVHKEDSSGEACSGCSHYRGNR